MPYWTRAEIESGKAPLADKVLVYVEDPVEAFFLEIQGSGRVALADGSVVRVGYADQNGHPYRSIGRVLIDRGEITLDRASMQGIREWGRQHPAELPALLDENPSYVFSAKSPRRYRARSRRKSTGPSARWAFRSSPVAPSPSIRAPYRSAHRSTSRRPILCRRGR